jgi:hypothetical protein
MARVRFKRLCCGRGAGLNSEMGVLPFWLHCGCTISNGFADYIFLQGLYSLGIRNLSLDDPN